MKLYHLVFILSITLCFVGCKSKTKKDVIEDSSNKIEFDSKSESKPNVAVKKIFLNLPSPIELTNTILSTDNAFDPSLLNPVENIENYASTTSLALNFGVYGADLCYCRVYEQLQPSINYLAVIRKITEKLQIPEEEGAQTINRIEENMTNKDSIFHIISETYANADGYLKENERELTATFILIGGWIEGMHFAVNLAENAKEGDVLIKRIAEQKYSLQNLMALLEEDNENQLITELYPLFNELANIYDKINITYEEPIVITDNKTKTTTIDNESKIDITLLQIKEIGQLISKIRSKIIS